MKTTITPLKVFAVILFIMFSFCTKAQGVSAQDSLALVDLYNNTGGPHWTDHTNWLTRKPVSSWFGITVSNGRVTEADLIYNNLTGRIPFSIGQLTAITYLRLNINNLSDTIPASIGNLVNLSNLVLDGNQLTGSIPSSVGNLIRLQQLNLETNQLSGSLPSSIGNLTELDELIAGGNQLTGSIPSSIKNLVNLEFLILYSNQLTGSIPDGIGKLKKLRSLNLSYNQLSGDIPLSLLYIGTLQYIQLENNKLINKKGTVYPSVPPRKNVQLNVGVNKLNYDILEFIDTTFTGDNVYTSGQLPIKIHQNGNTLSVYAGGTLSANTYLWYRSDKLVANITGDSSFQPTKSGLYNVVILNSIASRSGALSSYKYKYAEPESNSRSALIAGNRLSNGFVVYPNPANNLLHVRVSGAADITITNNAGQRVINKKINGNTDIDVSALRPGVYYLVDITTRKQQSFLISR